MFPIEKICCHGNRLFDDGTDDNYRCIDIIGTAATRLTDA
jgi:hypothetical protein